MAVTSLQITRRSVVLDGRPFAAAGAYEKIMGVLRIGVDPVHSANQAITDLAAAPRNTAGLVECEADFYLLKPCDPARGNRRLLLDVPNRGRKVALGLLNSTPRVPDPATGIRPVELLTPLATYTGWNPRHPAQGVPGDLMSMLGSTLPFPLTRAARQASGDPRVSIEERYASRAVYLARVHDSATRLVAERHMLAEDVDAVIERAGRLWDFIARA